MAQKKAGRPKSEFGTRDAEVSFSLSVDDAEWFTRLAQELGFRSRSEFWTQIAERLRLGGMAPVVWLKTGWQIANRAREVGASDGAGFVNPFLRLPPLDVEDRPRRPLIKPLTEKELSAAQLRLLEKVEQIS